MTTEIRHPGILYTVMKTYAVVLAVLAGTLMAFKDMLGLQTKALLFPWIGVPFFALAAYLCKVDRERMAAWLVVLIKMVCLWGAAYFPNSLVVPTPLYYMSTILIIASFALDLREIRLISIGGLLAILSYIPIGKYETKAVVLVTINYVLVSLLILTIKKAWDHSRLSYEKMLKKTVQDEFASRTNLLSNLSVIGELSAGIAHEIANPLAATQLLLNQIESDVDDPSAAERVKTNISKTHGSLNRLMKIIANLKSVARDGSKDPLGNVSVRHIIETTDGLIKGEIQKRGIRFESVSTEEVIMKSVKCRETEIVQVLLNLIKNSMDAVEMLPEKWIKLQVEEVSDSKLVFSVVDSGTGIPRELKDKIFDSFFTTKPKGKGTGIGLSISKKITTEHGGRIWVDDNSPNTCFKFDLMIS